MKYTLGQAAKATNRSKGTISGDIKSGKLSAEKLENGSYAIDASELIRVYGQQFNPHRSENGKLNNSEPLFNEQGGLKVEVERLREHLASIGTERERERQQLTEQIEDLRRRLDQSDQERRDKDRQLTALLTDQRERAAQPAPEPKPAAAEPPRRKGFRGWLHRITA